MGKKGLLIVMSIAMLGGTVASADVLWDQSDFDLFVPGFFNVESGSPPFGLTQYTVGDVTVGDGGWYVTGVSVFFGAADPSWGDAISEGYLHVYSKTGPLPGAVDDPTTSPLVPMSSVFNGDHFVVTASSLGLELAPGDYWIGITPIAPSGILGPEPHLATMVPIGDATASFDPFAFPGPPAWFNFNPGVDAAMTVEGVAFPSCDDDEGDDEGDDDEMDDDRATGLRILLDNDYDSGLRGGAMKKGIN